MRLNTRTCIGLLIALVVAVALVWKFNRAPRAEQAAAETPVVPPIALQFSNLAPAQAAPAVPVVPSRFDVVATNVPNAPFTNLFAYRLTNSTLPFEQLLRSDFSVLLRNALIDTRLGAPAIPAHLRAAGDPGAYIVQARGLITDEFRAALRNAGAEIVSYVPNNAYLVRASAAAARVLRGSPLTQSLLPFEPYYKFDARLLALAVNQQLSPHAYVNVVGYPNNDEGVLEQLRQMGAEVSGAPEPTIFGSMIKVKVAADRLADLAQLSGVQMAGVYQEKVLLNDLTRPLIRVSRTSTAPTPSATGSTQYGLPTTNDFLTGDGVMVAVADSGVDENHPDLVGRVFGPLDIDGHGTHVVGTLLGNGSQSSTVGVQTEVTGCVTNNGTNVTGCVTNTTSNARGSLPNANFYGMAPLAKAFVQDFTLSETFLQRSAALSNALISNNSWGRPGLNEYDIYAASYDAAVRDSLPGVTGPQQVAYVFAAGNEGGGGANGLNGIPGSIVSPATAKNVITVGASDLPRFITNEVVRACVTDTNTGITICETNSPWLGMTDTNNQVSPYSSRGNVGVGIEGSAGRFKPDVIAPGSMLISTRSSLFQETPAVTNIIPYQFNGLNLGFNRTNLYPLTIPPNAVALQILVMSNLLSPSNLTIQVGAEMDTPPGPGSAYGAGMLTLTPVTAPVALRAGTLFYSLANTTHSNAANFDLLIFLTVTNDQGNYYNVLTQLNNTVAPYYRYESGTSMAAPAISGFLALIQEYFTNQLQLRPSPALLKALLINGARSLGSAYDYQINPLINHQGWGIANLSNSLPFGVTKDGATGPLRFFDQTLTNSLVTGDSNIFTITVPPEAKSYPLRVTLVWSDPPGNPVTGVKLVNDMNLSLTANLTNQLGQGTNATTNSSSVIWLGNDFQPGSDFVEPRILSSTDTNATLTTNLTEVVSLVSDYVNNVENIYIRPPLAGSYTVVVKAHRVNVNAVNSHSNNVAQDYALVISSGNVAPSNNVNLASAVPDYAHDPAVRYAAMARPSNTTLSNRAFLINQRVGANAPLIVSTNGATNQWSFFTYQNLTEANYTNVVILTFLAPNLSRPRNREADIDLYVARGTAASNLLVLDNNAIASSRRSLGRGATEYVYFTDAQPGEIFYIGVKSEDQQAANFSIYAESRNGPFSDRDGSNNIIATAVGPVFIPDGASDEPNGVTNMFAFVLDPRDLQTTIQRVYVTNSIFHEDGGDLLGILNRPGGTNEVVLNNHRTWNGLDITVYDDSQQGDLGDEFSIPPVIEPDGPGRLRDFVGEPAGPIWNFTVSDNSLFHTGFVQEVSVVIEPASTNNSDPNIVVDRRFCIGAGRWVYVPVNIGFDVVNMETCLSDFESAPANPIQVYIRQGGFPDNVIYDHFFERLPPGDPCFDLGLGDNPPLTPGRWYIGMFNPNPDSVCLHLRVTLTRQNIPGPYSIYYSKDTPKNLLDDATTNSMIFIQETGRIADLRVGLRVAHERASDLAFHLRSPRGTRVLLMENRGRTNGLGIGANLTNVTVTVGRRVLYSGWDEQPVFHNLPAGQSASGWTVDYGNIDVVGSGYANCGGGVCFGCFGGICNAHSLTNSVDLNGNQLGSLSTNVPTISNQSYRISFAYSKNPNANPGVNVGRLDLGTATFFTFSYGLANSLDNQLWLETNFIFRANASSTRVAFSGVSPAGSQGIFIDTVKMEEIEIVTNLFLYTTFTENTNLTVTPIKFGIPPFTNSPNPSLGFVLNDGFEFLSPYVQGSPFNLPAGTPALNTDISGWHVDDDDVDVLSSFIGYGISDSGDHFLDINGLQPGQISTNITTEIGADYELRFAYRRNPGATSAPPVAEVRVIGATAAVLTNFIASPTDFNAWTNATLTFRANSAVSRVEVEGMSPLNENGVLFDSFTMRKSNLDPTLQSYFLPEEFMTPLFGESAFGAWTLEVWDSRMGPSAGSLSNALVSWKLEIAFPVVNPPFISITNPSQSVITNVAGDEVVYFAVDLPCFSGVVTNTLRNITGAGGLDLIFNQFTLPTNGPNDVILLTDVTGTENNVLTIGSPPLVSLTRYYLAVRNTNPGQSNQFELRVDFACATTNTFTLLTTNSYCTNIIAAPSVDYFRYQMPPGVLAVRFETYGADGNVDMAVQANGVPSTSSGLQSTQPGLNNELVQVMTNYPPSNPVNPTTWYIAIRNQDAATVNYCLKITEIYDITPLTLNVGLNQTIQSNGIQYYVVNIDSNYCGVFFNSTNHNLPVNLLHYINYGRLPSTLDYAYTGTALPGGIPRAIGPLPTNYPGGEWFIEVVNTNAVAMNFTMLVSTNSCFAPIAPVIKVDISSYSTNGFLLRWDAPISEQYQVQYTDSLLPANWQTIPDIVTSGTGNFIYTNIGVMTNAQRFYRLLRVP